MLSSGTKAVPSPACLRCQLRCVLQHLRPLPSTHPRPFTPHRTFSTTYSRHTADEGDIRPPAKEHTGGVYFKHVGPSGRIVGKRGRKQRQTSEALATNSLGEKSEIVVFRDVVQARKKPTDKQKEANYVDLGEQSLKGLSLTPEEIKAALSGTGQAPDDEEVTKSIDALRPQAPVLEENEYERLIKELLDSYNLKQLSRYLSQSLKSHHASMTVVRELQYRSRTGRSPNAIRTISFTRSRWQPGRTPLNERRLLAVPAPPEPRGKPLGSKGRAAERIVRVAWEITQKKEEQSMGELEIQMLPWALAIFFDVTSYGKPMYQTLIEPPLLLRRSEIRPYRLDNVIRITARRQDAEEIATQLENKVLLIGKQVIQIDKLLRTGGVTYPKGQSLQHFRQQDLDEISRLTHSIFMQQSDGSIGIYSFRQSDRENARRLLLSLLDLPSRNVTRMTSGPSIERPTEAGPASLALVPVFPDRGVHFRDRSKKLARAVLPVRRAMPTTSATTSYGDQADGISRRISSLIESFDRQKEEEPVATTERPSDSSVYWAGRPFKTSNTWWVHLGLLLEEATPEKSGLLLQDKSLHIATDGTAQRPSEKSVLLRQVPGYETLLSYFEPNRRPPLKTFGGAERSPQAPYDLIARKSTIVAHFMPNVFSHSGARALGLYPKLELTMHRRYVADSGETELKIDSLRATIGEHHIDVPLPDRAVDVRLVRKISAYAHLPAVLADPQVQQFVTALKESANSKGALQGTTEVTLKMPGWMAEEDIAIRTAQDDSLPEIGVPYLFERFEQVQSTGFTKNTMALDKRAEHNTAIHAFNDSFPNNARLQYSEIEAGDIGGRQTEISFKVHKAQPHGGKSSEKEPDVDELKVDQPQQDGPDLKSILVPALAIADFVTKACKQEVTPWRGSSGLEQFESISRLGTESESPAIEEAQAGETPRGDVRLE
jgi:hypothetical protein